MSKKRTPIKKKLSVVEQIALLSCIEDVDEMLLGEATATDVARFVQRDRGELTDVKEATLAKALSERRRDLLMRVQTAMADEAEDQETAAMQDAIRPRVPGAIARGAYQKMRLGMDALIELESLYLSARDRIGQIMEWEADNQRFYGDMHKEFATAAGIIEKHAKLSSELGMAGQDRFSMRLDVRGMRSRHGSTIAEVLAKPESRHKVLALLDQLRSLGDGADVIDIDGEPSGAA